MGFYMSDEEYEEARAQEKARDEERRAKRRAKARNRYATMRDIADSLHMNVYRVNGKLYME